MDHHEHATRTRPAISPLRQRMIEDMTIRRFGDHTKRDYIRQVAEFTAFLGRSPDQAEPEDLRRYQLHLASLGASYARMNLACTALRFFFHITLGRTGFGDRMARIPTPERLPVVLSTEEVALLLAHAPNLNQGGLHEDVALLFSEQMANDFKNIRISTATDTDAGHGRIESRQVFATDDIDWLKQRHDWAGLRSIVMVLSTRETDTGKSTERRFYIASLPADAEKLGAAIRQHWGVENSLHWVLDVNFRDDDCRIRKKNAPANFTAVKRATLNAPRKAPGKDSLKSKRLIAAWDEEFLAKTLQNL